MTLSQNKIRLAYLASLTLLFSYVEMFLPRFVPFFRLGLGNIAILASFNLSFPSFIALTLIKAISQSMLSGTLISPFVIVSISQSVASGLVMYLMSRIKSSNLSIYGISLAGGAVSSLVQIVVSSLYLGQGVMNLLGPMLLFSSFASLVTAFFYYRLELPEETPILKDEDHEPVHSSFFVIFVLCISLISIVYILMIKNIYVLLVLMIASFIIQAFSGRKIRFLPHISLWVFVIVSSLMLPKGKVLYRILGFALTKGSLMEGILKALKLSILMCISQSFASMRFKASGVIGLSLCYFKHLSNEYRKVKGPIWSKVHKVLKAKEL